MPGIELSRSAVICPRSRSADRESQRQTLGRGAIAIGRERLESGARRIGKDRIFADLEWEEFLREGGDEHHVERHPPHFVRGTDIDRAVTRPFGRAHQCAESRLEHHPHFARFHRTDAPHRREFGEHRENAFGASERAGRERAELI